MRVERKSFIKIAVSEAEREAYESAANRKAQTLSEWMRLSLAGVLESIGYKMENLAVKPKEPTDAIAGPVSPNDRLYYDGPPGANEFVGVRFENMARKERGLDPIKIEEWRQRVARARRH